MTVQARRSPDYLEHSVIYQLYPRAFTPQGTLSAAARLLPHLAELGVDIVYLTPVVEHDEDPRRELWSPRQQKSGLENPKNPYRLRDYVSIDAEYGTEADLRDFVRRAHELGLRVLLDLVYMHCGPNASFIAEHPDYVQHTKDGQIRCSAYHFPLINFESGALREYLWENMEYFMREFGVDGYRCDVAAAIPLDFWEEGRRRMEAIKPDCMMISEGDRQEDQLAAFDLNYGFYWKYGILKVLETLAPSAPVNPCLQEHSTDKVTAADLRKRWHEKREAFPEGARFLRILDDHDIANDCYDLRHDRAFGTAAVDAALVVNFTIDGVPFLYNGQEIADTARHSIYSNRFHGNMHIDWANALTETGRSRIRHLQQLIRLRRAKPALSRGDVQWLENEVPEALLTFTRNVDGQQVLVAVNLSESAHTTTLAVAGAARNGEILLARNAGMTRQADDLDITLLPYGYLVVENLVHKH